MCFGQGFVSVVSTISMRSLPPGKTYSPSFSRDIASLTALYSSDLHC